MSKAADAPAAVVSMSCRSRGCAPRASTDVLVEEGQQSFVERLLMFLRVEAVAFGTDEKRLDGDPRRTKRLLHLLAVCDRRALVLPAGGEEDRHLDPSCQVHGRHRAERGGIADPIVQIRLARV